VSAGYEPKHASPETADELRLAAGRAALLIRDDKIAEAVRECDAALLKADRDYVDQVIAEAESRHGPYGRVTGTSHTAPPWAC
jgi:hypothetical protein